MTRADIVALGVGGLLMEIVSRPQPRAGGDQRRGARRAGRRMSEIGTVLLAAGLGSRFGPEPKLLAPLERDAAGAPRRQAALGARPRPVVAVLGAHADRVRDALAGLDLILAVNPDFRLGLATSLRAGLAACHLPAPPPWWCSATCRA